MLANNAFPGKIVTALYTVQRFLIGTNNLSIILLVCSACTIHGLHEATNGWQNECNLENAYS
jgi:hypothetical protein